MELVHLIYQLQKLRDIKKNIDTMTFFYHFWFWTNLKESTANIFQILSGLKKGLRA